VASLLEGPLATMSKAPWASVTEVGDQSAYVAEMTRLLRLVIPRIRARMGEDSFRVFCDKFARTFTARYSSAIFRCKKIGELGAQQLLLDAQAIRALLLNAPTLRGISRGASAGDDDEIEGAGDVDELAAPAPGGYVSFVQREMPRVEMLLKIIASPKERFADTIKALWPSATAADVTLLMELKSTPKKEQQEVLAQLGLAAKAALGGGLADVSAGVKEMGAKLTVAGGMGKLFGAMGKR
jgi:vacuolar protein sorting-associated protein 53